MSRWLHWITLQKTKEPLEKTEEAVAKLAGHRILALNRGEKEKFLTVKVIGTTVIYPTAPTTEKKIQVSKDLLKKIIPKYHISLIYLGKHGLKLH